MRDPTGAAHALGKVIKYCGENNVLWGTDSIWYGSPQDQIQAFRTFQIAPELRAMHGYPEITAALRAKIFGLNASRVYALSAEREVKKHTRADRITQERYVLKSVLSRTSSPMGPRPGVSFRTCLDETAHRALSGNGASLSIDSAENPPFILRESQSLIECSALSLSRKPTVEAVEII